MCNLFRSTVPLHELREEFSQLRIPLRFPRGPPNLEPRQEVRITEAAPVIRRDESGDAELVQLRWSWPGPQGKPVFNFRAEGRRFERGRCLVPVSGFYEFTAAEGAPRARKAKWLFTVEGESWFCLAGLWRPGPAGDAFTLLTVAPGPDVEPFHDRQLVILARHDWRAWLERGDADGDLLRALPAGSLRIERVA